MSRVFIDANLMCLVVAGLFAPDAIGRHKRLRAFTNEDFEAVQAIISEHDEVACSPHVLTETSNLLGQTNDAEARKLRVGLHTLVKGMTELRVASVQAMERPEYPYLGLTDAVILFLQDHPAHLLTVDAGLAVAAFKAGIDVVNYNWLRDNE